MVSIILPTTKFIKGRVHECWLAVTTQWRESCGGGGENNKAKLTKEALRERCSGCFAVPKSIAQDTSIPIGGIQSSSKECTQCGSITNVMATFPPVTIIPASLNRGNYDEYYQINVRARCTSSRAHLKASTLCLVIDLPEASVRVISEAFVILARDHNRTPMSPHSAPSSASPTPLHKPFASPKESTPSLASQPFPASPLLNLPMLPPSTASWAAAAFPAVAATSTFTTTSAVNTPTMSVLPSATPVIVSVLASGVPVEQAALTMMTQNLTVRAAQFCSRNNIPLDDYALRIVVSPAKTYLSVICTLSPHTTVAAACFREFLSSWALEQSSQIPILPVGTFSSW